MYLAAAIGGVALVPLLLEDVGYQPRQTFLAILLMEICLYPTVRYFAHKESGLPTMPIFCLAFALQYAFPFFTREATMELARGETRYLNDSDVTAALLLAVIGISAMLVGYYSFRKTPFKKVIPVTRLPLDRRKAVLFCLMLGLLLPLLFNLRSIVPQEYQLPLSAILGLLQNQVYVVIGVLGWIVYERKASPWYSVWLYALVIIVALRGISSGMLEEAVAPVAVLFLVRWLYTRRFSAPMVAAVIVLILFLSPVKSEYRREIRTDEGPRTAEMSTFTKASLWITQAGKYWAETFSGSRGLVEATSNATSRADFLHQMAHTYSMTPDEVPYQYGATYSYFAVALIPRVIWPNKPLAGSANGFYAVNYGITSEEGIKTTTFGVSILGEAFINFGWYGALFVMMFQGFIISLLEYIFGGPQSGPGGRAVFIAFFVFFLNGIGSSAEIMFGGILQNLVCGCLLLWWARSRVPRQSLSRLVPSSALSFNAEKG